MDEVDPRDRISRAREKRSHDARGRDEDESSDRSPPRLSTIAPLLGERVVSASDEVLKEMLGSPLPEKEAEMWAALTPAKRDAAARRLTALRDWIRGGGAMSVADAAALAKISPSGFYRLAADWRRERARASLGGLATADRSKAARVSVQVNAALLRHAAKVVREEQNASVRAQVASLRRMAADLGAEMPGESRLRQYVEQERRRVATRAAAGSAVAFDCSACSLTRPDGRPWVIFALIDRATKIVLSFQLGDVAISARAFAPTVQDFLRRVGTPWSGT